MRTHARLSRARQRSRLSAWSDLAEQGPGPRFTAEGTGLPEGAPGSPARRPSPLSRASHPRWTRAQAPCRDRWPGPQGRLPLGFHLNNELTQVLTSRYRDSRLRVDLERFVSCAARLTRIFRHCSQRLGGREGVVCLTHSQWMEVAAF